MGRSSAAAPARPTIAYQGEPGAFSHVACLTWYAGHDARGYATFAEVFGAAERGDCDLGLVPVENSTAGPVPEVAELLEETDLVRVAEYRLPISLHLMATPGARLQDLRTAASHLMALRQCGAALRRLGLEPVAAPDTAGAARALANAPDPTRGVVASEAAASLYGLSILLRDVQDQTGNATRFLVLARAQAATAAPSHRG